MGMPVIVGSKTTREQAINDLIESVALQETGLSHIINAEGEKLQKVIANTNCIEQLLETNKSVTDMIVSITHLELILYDKLKMASCM